MKMPMLTKTINFTDAGFLTINQKGEQTAHTRRFYKKMSFAAVVRELKKEFGIKLVRFPIHVANLSKTYEMPVILFMQVATPIEPLKGKALSE